MLFLFALPWVTFQLFSQRLASPRGGGGWKGGEEVGEREGGEGRGAEERRGEAGEREETEEEVGAGKERGEGGGKGWTSSPQSPARHCPHLKAASWDGGRRR